MAVKVSREMAYRYCRAQGWEPTPRNLNAAFRAKYRELNPEPPKSNAKRMQEWQRRAWEREKAIRKAQKID